MPTPKGTSRGNFASLTLGLFLLGVNFFRSDLCLFDSSRGRLHMSIGSQLNLLSLNHVAMSSVLLGAHLLECGFCLLVQPQIIGKFRLELLGPHLSCFGNLELVAGKLELLLSRGPPGPPRWRVRSP